MYACRITARASGAVEQERTNDGMAKTDIAKVTTLPALDQLEKELYREKHKSRGGRIIRWFFTILLLAASIFSAFAVMYLPVFRIYGASMEPTLNEGEIVVGFHSGSYDQGDMIAFYYNNKILIKRIIAGPGDTINIRRDGVIYINGRQLQEPYLKSNSFGTTNIDLPMTVPEGRWFVAGDNRSISVDSRNEEIGCVFEEQIIGELVVRVWPFERIGDITGQEVFKEVKYRFENWAQQLRMLLSELIGGR